MKIIFIQLSILCFSINVVAQNLVPNHSFEELDGLHPNSPTGPGQLEHAKDWKLIGTDNLTNTTDLNSDLPGKFKFGGSPTTAHTGHNFTGFGGCEGAQVKLTHKLESMHWVTVSFWFAAEESYNRTISVYLCNNKMDNINCDNPVVPHEIYMEAEVNGATLHAPGNWYFYQSQPILVTTDDIEWLLIKQLDTYGTAVFVDDVSVEQFGFCQHICATNNPGMQFTNIVPTGMIGNSYQNFFTTIKNANEVEMFVWDRWGELAYYSHSFDAAGLKDPGYNDFALVWNGHSTLTGGDMIAGQVYNIQILARSCVNVVPLEYNGSITLVEILNPPALIYPETQIATAPDCCPNQKYYQNYNFNGSSRTNVDDFISAGYSVTASPYGNVVVQSGADVEFRAGNSISLNSGFIIQPGSQFRAIIEPCGASSSGGRIAKSPRAYYEGLRTQHAPEPTLTESGPFVFPNPTNGAFNIEFKALPVQQITIYDAVGKIIAENKVVDNSTSANFSLAGYPSGIYFIKINTSEKIITKKIVKE